MAKETGDIGEKAKLSSQIHNFSIVGIGASAHMNKILLIDDDEDDQALFKEALELINP